MNQEVVKQINHLRVEQAELKTLIKQAELNEDYADEKEDLEKELASVENEIKKLASQLSKPIEIGNAE